jgi:hypothetical protein
MWVMEEIMRPHVVVTPSTLVFSLAPEHLDQARQCIEKSGQLSISFKEVSVTNLTEIRELSRDGVIID